MIKTHFFEHDEKKYEVRIWSDGNKVYIRIFLDGKPAGEKYTIDADADAEAECDARQIRLITDKGDYLFSVDLIEEMIETANILNTATPDSLILLYEIGRGTSTFDGLSLAWAIIEYIEKYKHSLTLFATHYHELTELESIYPDIRNYNIAVREYNEQIIFLRKIERGGADQSYGIQVARLAGIPERVIRRAKEILKNLEEHEISPQGLASSLRKKLQETSPQMELFEVLAEKADELDPIINEIKDLDLDSLTPIQAWQKLKELQDKL